MTYVVLQVCLMCFLFSAISYNMFYIQSHLFIKERFSQRQNS